MSSVNDKVLSVGVMCEINSVESSTSNPNIYPPELTKVNKDDPLSQLVELVCKKWKIAEPQKYSLRLSNKKLTDVKFVTEQNKHEITVGSVLQLTLSPGLTADSIVEKLQVGSEPEKRAALAELTGLSHDTVFAQEFMTRKGHESVLELLQNESLSGSSLSAALKMVVDFTENSIMPWDVMDEKLVTALCKLVNRDSRQSKVEASALQHALDLVESTLSHCQSPEVRVNALAVLCALLERADPATRCRRAACLQEKTFRDDVVRLIYSVKPLPEALRQQLAMLQGLLFSLLNQRRLAAPGAQYNEEVSRAIKELRIQAFENDMDTTGTTGRKRNQEEYRKLGFQNCAQPSQDFQVVPPGLLALDNMVYFAKLKQENFQKVIVENTARDCRFATASIQLTRILCEILRIGDSHNEELRAEPRFHPMFFTHDSPFHEFYCLCVESMNKMWREMRAHSGDIKEVLFAVEDQVNRALAEEPLKFEHFKDKLEHFNYPELTKLWNQKRKETEESLSQAAPIRELREMLTPEINDLVKTQRLNFLVEGTQFKHTYKRKEKFWYCRLSHNHKTLHYGDCEEGRQPPVDHLVSKLAVADIKRIITGKDCPHTKDKNKVKSLDVLNFLDAIKTPDSTLERDSFSLYFTLQTDPDLPSLDFVAPSAAVADMWTDGVHALLGQPMRSATWRSELTELLNMEVKLRLLDTEGVAIPEQPPPIPKEPPNLDFLGVS